MKKYVKKTCLIGEIQINWDILGVFQTISVLHCIATKNSVKQRTDKIEDYSSIFQMKNYRVPKKKVWLYSIQWFFYCKGISLVHRPFLVLERLSLPQLSPVLLLRWSRSERSSVNGALRGPHGLIFTRPSSMGRYYTLKSFRGIRNISNIFQTTTTKKRKLCETPKR